MGALDLAGRRTSLSSGESPEADTQANVIAPVGVNFSNDLADALSAPHQEPVSPPVSPSLSWDVQMISTFLVILFWECEVSREVLEDGTRTRGVQAI